MDRIGLSWMVGASFANENRERDLGIRRAGFIRFRLGFGNFGFYKVLICNGFIF